MRPRNQAAMAADEAAAADGDEQGGDVGPVGFELGGEGALAEQGFGLVVGVDGQGVGSGNEIFAGGQGVGVTCAGDHEFGAIGADAGDFGRGGDFGHEDGGFDVAAHGGIGNGGAVIAAGGGNHAGGGNAAGEEVGDGAARLEGTAVLEEFELEGEGVRRQAEIGGVGGEDGGVADVGADERGDFGDAVGCYGRHGVVRGADEGRKEALLF